MPPIIDLAKVEQVKTLYALGKNQSQIAKMLDISRRTVSRYYEMEDPPEIAGELSMMRADMVKKFGEVAWPLMFGFFAELKNRLEEGKMSPRDLLVGIGILADKLNGFDAMSKGANRSAGSTAITIQLFDESKCGVISHSNELPLGELPIQGDDMRPGSGEDIQRLPGGFEDGLSVPEELGGDSRFDVQELGGFRPADDPGGALGKSGDAGGLGRTFCDEQTVDGGDL